MGGAPQVAMRVASQIWQIIFASQTFQVFRLALRKKAQYVVVWVKSFNTWISYFRLTLGTFTLTTCYSSSTTIAIGLLNICT
jgi:hypothetical protein